MPKTNHWRRVPIPSDLALAMLEQQRRVRERFGDEAKFLFPSPARSNEQAKRVHPWSPGGFRKHITASFVRNGITHSAITGEEISGGAIHRYRHTIGTALLNAGWSQREVSEFLGHLSETMTSAYAKILDETLVRKIQEFHETTIATQRSGSDASVEGVDVDPVVERMRARFTYELPDGGCTLPANQKCDIRDNPCADCAFFEGGGVELRPIHEDRRRRLKLHIEATSDPRELAMNQKALDQVERLLSTEGGCLMAPRSDREVRIARLAARSQQRSQTAEAKVRRALLSLTNRGLPISFSIVADEADVSESYLRKHATFAPEIRQHTQRPSVRLPRETPQVVPDVASLKTKMLVMADRIRALEAENKTLKSENATLRAEVLAAKRAARR